MGHKLTYHGLPNTKGSSFNLKLPLCHRKKPCQKLRLPLFTPLTPMIDQNRISPYNFNTL